VPRPLGDIVASALMETMSLMLPSTGAETFARAAVEPALEFAATKQAVALGPGISQHPETREFALEFVRRCPVPLLVDADGLNALSTNPEALAASAEPKVLTPHPGEMARLSGCTTAEVQQDRVACATAFAARHHCVVVLKGHGTVVADPGGGVFVNSTGNSGLAKGGTGDVLSGLIGGLMAQRLAPLHAAVLGVFVHGLAGDVAAARKTERGMIASDVLAALPEAWRCVEQGV
jgi:NAD(P)H-hydrate epimerase